MPSSVILFIAGLLVHWILADDGTAPALHGSRVSLLARLRDYLHLACHSAGLLRQPPVPHQLRHTYGTEMSCPGVGFAAVMKLLRHTDPGMTMRMSM